MNSSAPAAQDAQKQTTSSVQTEDSALSAQSGQAQTVAQPTSSTQKAPVPTQVKTPISVSGGGGLEAGSAVIMTEDTDDDEEDEALQIAPQEKKNLGVMGQGDQDEQGDEQQIVSQVTVADAVEEVAEVKPAVPEVVASSPEVEKLIEITPPEQPKINQELKNIGVTHSGPGVIDASQANSVPAKIPITYEQAVTQEELIKVNRAHTSKYWLLEKIKYLWRKVNPNLDTTVKRQVALKVVPVKTFPANANAIPAQKVTVTKSTSIQ